MSLQSAVIGKRATRCAKSRGKVVGIKGVGYKMSHQASGKEIWFGFLHTYVLSLFTSI